MKKNNIFIWMFFSILILVILLIFSIEFLKYSIVNKQGEQIITNSLDGTIEVVYNDDSLKIYNLKYNQKEHLIFISNQKQNEINIIDATEEIEEGVFYDQKKDGG